VLVGVLSGSGLSLLLQSLVFRDCTLNRVEHLRTESIRHHSQHKNVASKAEKYKNMQIKPSSHTEMLWVESVEIKYENPRYAEGQESEGREDLLEHLYDAVDFCEVGREHVEAKEVSIECLVALEDLARYVVEDENNMKGKNRVMATKQPTLLGSPRIRHLWVNLSGGSAEKHPGQEEQCLWMKHTARMVAQGQIISWVKKVMEEDLGVGAVTDQNFVYNLLYLYREYRQYPVQLDTVEAKKVAEVNTNMGVVVMTVRDSMDEQKVKRMKDFSPCSAHKLHKKRPGGVPRSIHCCNRRNTCWAMLDRQWPLNCSETSSTCGAVPAGRHSEI